MQKITRQTQRVSETKVAAIHAAAAAYGATPAPELADDGDLDPLGLEKAFDKAFAGKPAHPVDDDPCGIDAAFDSAFASCGGGGADRDGSEGGDSASDSVDVVDVSASEGSNTPIHDSDDDITDAEVEGEEADLAVDDFRQSVRKMHESHFFSRVGSRIYYREKLLGTITGFGNSVACHCRLHSGCKAPASTRWGSDAVLEQWLLDGVKPRSGDARIDKAQHQGKIAGIHAKRRLRQGLRR